jgi:hypothetical protein
MAGTKPGHNGGRCGRRWDGGSVGDCRCRHPLPSPPPQGGRGCTAVVAAALSHPTSISSRYRVGTGAGGDERDARDDGFAPVARDLPCCGVSTDSRYEVSAQAELELAE